MYIIERKQLALSLFLFITQILYTLLLQLKMINTRQLQFDKGIMRLSAYDPVSNQYETRTLTLPELPMLESLEHLFNNNSNNNNNSTATNSTENNNSKLFRLTKSCNNKKSSKRNSIRHDVVLTPRRCQSNPNLSKQQQKSFKGM